MTQREWIDLARARIRRMLNRRRFASVRQLEKKISEAGPPNIRPEPVKLSRALRELVHEGHITLETIPVLGAFYKPADFGGPDDEDRRETVILLTRQFRRLAGNTQLCGKALERIVHNAALQSGRYVVLGSPEHPLGAVNGYTIERECDHILVPKDFPNLKLVVEDKNLREWLHPSAEEVWALIGKALRIPGGLPVLICRKMHYVGFTVFKHIGLTCWQVYRQYFAPSAESDLVAIRHTDGLGFSDVTTAVEPPPSLVRFFEQTIPQNIATFAARFNQYRVLLSMFAIDNQMELEETGSYHRSRLFRSFEKLVRHFSASGSGGSS